MANTTPPTKVTYNLDGSTREYLIPYEYLSRKFIRVTLVNPQTRRPLTLNVDFRFVGPGTIRLTRAWGPADGYVYIELNRYTSATERLVDFNDGSILRAYDLNISQVQAIHIAEEGRNIANTALVLDGAVWDARSKRITNVRNPVAGQDAATAGWVTRLCQSAYERAAAYADKIRAGAQGGINWFKQLGHGAVDRTYPDKMRDTVHPKDFGAVADNKADDTAAFEALEKNYRGIQIDLNGMHFKVQRDFNGNRYVNGKLFTPTVMLSKEEKPIKTDVVRGDYNYNSALRYDIKSILGNTESRGAQAFCFDERIRALYLMENGMMCRYDMDGPVDAYEIDNSASPSPYIGHQGLSVEYLRSGVKFWSTSAIGGRYAYRFDYVAGQPLGPGDNYKLFTDGLFANSSSCTPSVSTCGLYLIAHGTRWGTMTTVIRVFEMRVLVEGGSGDYSDKWLYEWETQGLVREGNPLQATACDGANVFLYAGGTGFGSNTYKRLYTFSLKGELIMKEDNLRIGRGNALTDGSGVKYEAEGLAILQGPTGSTLCVGVMSGDVRARRYRIYGVGMAIPMNAKSYYVVGNTTGSIGSSTATGREYMSIRGGGGGGLDKGAGINLYGIGDSGNNGGVGVFTGTKTRLAIRVNGEQVSTADVGVTPFTARMDGTGVVMAFDRGPLKVGGVSVSTLNMNIFTRTGLDLQFGSMSAENVISTNWRISSATGAFHPQVSGTQNIGTASVLIDTLYAKNPTINTSDERLKTPIRPLTDAEKRVGIKLMGIMGSFKWLEEQAENGEAARRHVGMGVQSAIEVFKSEGLDAFEYGAVCYDEWDEVSEVSSPAVYDEQGRLVSGEVVTVRPAGNRYSLRASEIQYLMLGAIGAALMNKEV